MADAFYNYVNYTELVASCKKILFFDRNVTLSASIFMKMFCNVAYKICQNFEQNGAFPISLKNKKNTTVNDNEK